MNGSGSRETAEKSAWTVVLVFCLQNRSIIVSLLAVLKSLDFEAREKSLSNSHSFKAEANGLISDHSDYLVWTFHTHGLVFHVSHVRQRFQFLNRKFRASVNTHSGLCVIYVLLVNTWLWITAISFFSWHPSVCDMLCCHFPILISLLCYHCHFLIDIIMDRYSASFCPKS